MKKIFSFLLLLSGSTIFSSDLFSAKSSTTSIDTQPWTDEKASLLNKHSQPNAKRSTFGSTMPRGGTAINAAALEDFLNTHTIVNIAYTPRTSRLEGNHQVIPVEVRQETQDQYLEIQNGRTRSLCIPFCILLTCSWIIGASTMGILKLTGHKS